MSAKLLTLSNPFEDAERIANYVREGRFQRSLSLLTAATSIVSGLEVAYEHYRGSYSRRVMYTPVILSGVLAIAGIAAFFSRRAARTVLRLAAFVTLVDALVGFYFHARGVARDDHWLARLLPPCAGRELIGEEQDVREGKFQRQVAIVTGVSALLSGFEAYYSHYKNNFRYKAQWSPILSSFGVSRFA